MNKNLFSIISLTLFTCVLFFACNKKGDSVTYDGAGTGYFPLTIGHSVTYQLDSIVYNDAFCTIDSSHYIVKYIISDTFTDNTGRPSYRMDVFQGKDSSALVPSNEYYIVPTNSSIEMVMDNLRFVKLALPILEGNNWNGNNFININDQSLQYFSNWQYTYKNVGASFGTGYLSTNNSVTVEEIDDAKNDPSLPSTQYAYKTFSKEVYGMNIGLMYRELEHWVYDTNIRPCKKGYKVILRATDYN